MEIQAPSARCEPCGPRGRTPQLLARALAALLLFAGLVSAATSQDGGWLDVSASGTAEEALRDAIARAAFDGPEGGAKRLAGISEAHPGSVASGLAHLAAGLALLDAGEAPELALEQLRHPDVRLTDLGDHVAYAVARALEAEEEHAAAGAAFLAVAEDAHTPLACRALSAAAESFVEAENGARAVDVLNRALLACPGDEPGTLARIAEVELDDGDEARAAATLDELDRRFPASPEARRLERQLRRLAPLLPVLSPAQKTQRTIDKAFALFGAGERRDVAMLLRPIESAGGVGGEQLDMVRIRLARALMAIRRTSEGRAVLGRVGADSPHAGEAAYHAAQTYRGTQRLQALEDVVRRYPDTPWSEEALLDLGNHFQKDQLYEQALPYYRRLLIAHPEGERSDRARWYVGIRAVQSGRHEEAARLFAEGADQDPDGPWSPAFHYWAGRARLALGETQAAQQRFRETVRRFKHSYYGSRAAELLAPLPASRATGSPAVLPARADAAREIPEPQRTRLRQLLLIERYEEGLEELAGLRRTPGVLATRAWIQSRRGELRSAITAMKQAYPDHVSEAGTALPEAVWKLIFPLPHAQALREQAVARGVDPALVAGLVCQESTFDAEAISRAGARGLMQIMPATGQQLARQARVRYSRSRLLDPEVSLQLGTLYLRQMLDRFGGRVERALAAYNAGPHRVDTWERTRPGLSAEEFIESIPFTETRIYVKIVLGNADQYRRIYGL